MEAGRGRAAVLRACCATRAGCCRPAARATRRSSSASSRCCRRARSSAWTGWGGKPRQYTFDFIAGELGSAQYLWGYLMTAIAVGLMPLVLLAWRMACRAAAAELALAAAGALLVTWLQPWQGGTLVLVIAVAEGARAGGGRASARRAGCSPSSAPPARPPPTTRCSSAPTPRGSSPARSTRPATRRPGAGRGGRSRSRSRRSPCRRRSRTGPPAREVAGPRRARVAARGAGDLPRARRHVPLPRVPGHGDPARRARRPGRPLGLGAPARLAGRRRRWRCSSCRAPCTASRSRSTRSAPRATRTSSSRASRRRSTSWTADPRPGGVLAPAYGGHMLPYRTGREVYVGALSWTPDWDARVRETRALFEGDMPPAAGAGAGAALRRALRVRRLPARACATCGPCSATLIARVRRFGCATVYELRP